VEAGRIERRGPRSNDQLEILDRLPVFSGDSNVADALLRRLKTTANPWREAELLPVIVGEKRVPPLFEALDRFKDRPWPMVVSIVVGLMRATGLALAPDGKVSSIAAGVDPEVCDVIGCPLNDDAVSRVADHWRKWWEIHKEKRSP